MKDGEYSGTFMKDGRMMKGKNVSDHRELVNDVIRRISKGDISPDKAWALSEISRTDTLKHAKNCTPKRMLSSLGTFLSGILSKT